METYPSIFVIYLEDGPLKNRGRWFNIDARLMVRPLSGLCVCVRVFSCACRSPGLCVHVCVWMHFIFCFLVRSFVVASPVRARVCVCILVTLYFVFACLCHCVRNYVKLCQCVIVRACLCMRHNVRHQSQSPQWPRTAWRTSSQMQVRDLEPQSQGSPTQGHLPRKPASSSASYDVRKNGMLYRGLSSTKHQSCTMNTQCSVNWSSHIPHDPPQQNAIQDAARTFGSVSVRRLGVSVRFGPNLGRYCGWINPCRKYYIVTNTQLSLQFHNTGFVSAAGRRWATSVALQIGSAFNFGSDRLQTEPRHPWM